MNYCFWVKYTGILESYRADLDILIAGNARAEIAPIFGATESYYPNQEPPAALLASFRRSV